MVNQKARIAIAVIPVAVLVALLAADISIFGADSILGASQVALMHTYADVLRFTFHLSPWLLVVPVLTVIMIWRRLPALVVLAISSVLATVTSPLFPWSMPHSASSTSYRP